MEKVVRLWHDVGGLAKVVNTFNDIGAWKSWDDDIKLGNLKSGDLLILLEPASNKVWVRAISKHGICIVRRNYVDDAR
jgi:hypothetical protein